jgi:hypothetical protein
VYETGRRFLSPRVGLIGALIATLQPYLLWHDVHGNREILDGLLGVSMFFLALLVAERRSVGLAALLGLVAGVAILSNARLFALPLVLGAYLLWRGVGWTAALVVPVLAAVALAPWLVRNQVAVGCLAITTDARALWKANNLETYGTLRAGGWIDNVPDIPERRVSPIPDRWLNAQEAGEIYENHGRRVEVDECAQQSHYQGLVWDFWREHPGEKAKLAAQATWMMWRPNVAAETGPNQSIDRLRTWVQPLYTVPLFVGALVGLFLVSRSFRVLALAFLVYQTAMAWIFAGTTRYRVPWDFVLALLAAVALERAVERVRAGREARVPGGRVDVAYDARR